MRYIQQLFIYLLLSISTLIAYIYLSNFWILSTEPSITQINLEIPILLILLILLYFPIKNIFKSILFATIPLLLSYGLFDVFYIFLKRSARVSDFQNLLLVPEFSPLFTTILVLITISMIYPIILLMKYFYQKNTKSTFIKTIFLKLILLISIFTYLNQVKINDYFLKEFVYLDWSQARTIRTNGRFASFIYYNKISQLSYEKVKKYIHTKLDVNKLIFGNDTIKKRRNVYMVVLESFIDPRLLTDINYNRPPISKDLAFYLQGKGFSKVISPIYGGGTAQAEFEVLTGIEALAKVDTVEFNTLMGSKISGFVNLLLSKDYNAYATIATNSNYFNSKSAYKSIGFDNLTFLEETSDYHHRDGDYHIFDGDLYDYNINKIKKIHKSKKQYIFYTLGMYGHMPYLRNKYLRKDMVHNYTTKDDRVDRIATQFYYRTKALAKYIKDILAIDPHSIIYISSDHLPPLINGGLKYDLSNFTNVALLLVDGQNVKIDGLKYYQVPRYIWNVMTENKKHIKDINQSEEENIYFKSLSESL